MERICKDCGKKFILTDGEVEFYRSKGLNLPKRCKACRNLNKPNRSTSSRYTPKPAKKKSNFIVPSVLLLGVVLTALVFSIFPSQNNNNDVLYDDFSTSYTEEVTSNYTEEIASNYTEEITSSYIEEVTSSYIEEVTSTYTEKIATSSIENYTFRKSEYLDEHYQKHGVEMGFSSASEYLKGANKVIVSSEVLTTTQDDNDTAYFLEKTGEFVVLSSDNYIRTYFIPEDGIEYFNRQ